MKVYLVVKGAVSSKPMKVVSVWSSDLDANEEITKLKGSHYVHQFVVHLQKTRKAPESEEDPEAIYNRLCRYS